MWKLGGLMAKKQKLPECPEKHPGVTKAEKIFKQYEQLSKCCGLLSEAKKQNVYRSMHTGGWRVWESSITDAGIDVEEVYDHIVRLAHKRKAELELELSKLDT